MKYLGVSSKMSQMIIFLILTTQVQMIKNYLICSGLGNIGV